MGFETPNNLPAQEKKEIEQEQSFVPLFNSEDQATEITNPDLLKESSYKDPTLFTVSMERTKASKEIAKKRGTGMRGEGEGLLWAIDNIDPAVGKNFDAHGFSKGDPVDELDCILTDGIQQDRTLYSMSFERAGEAAGAIGADLPHISSGIILLSEFGKKLQGGGIKYVALGEEYNRVVNLLKEKYPQVQFIPWNDVPKVLAEEATKITGQLYRVPKLTNENMPRYKKVELGNKLKHDVPIPGVEIADKPSEEVW